MCAESGRITKESLSFRDECRGIATRSARNGWGEATPMWRMVTVLKSTITSAVYGGSKSIRRAKRQE